MDCGKRGVVSGDGDGGGYLYGDDDDDADDDDDDDDNFFTVQKHASGKQIMSKIMST